MRWIRKSLDEPTVLLEYRKSAGDAAYWDGFSGKDLLRDRLIQEQGAICCYCMRRIDSSTMKIEHYLSKSHHHELELSWNNLLGACSGNEGEIQPLQTCDTSKADSAITIDPRIQRHTESLRYGADGTILSVEFDSDVNKTLNINTARLKELRKQSLDGFRIALQKRLGRQGPWSKKKIQAEMSRISSKSRLPEFAGMHEWWLKKKLQIIHTNREA